MVLTGDGEFRRVPLDRPGRNIGEEIALPPAVIGRPLRFLSLAAFAAAAVLLLALIPSLLRGALTGTDELARSHGQRVVLAYVTVDINPSIELGVDDAGRVVTARAVNADGEALLRDVNYAERPLDEVLDYLAGAAMRRGYLAAGRENAVVIAAVPAGEGRSVPVAVKRKVAEGERRVRRLMREERLPAEVGVIEAPGRRIREEAAAAGLSVGKYLIYLEMRNAGITVTTEELREAPLGRLIKEKGLRPGEVIEKARQERDFEGMAGKFAPPLRRPGLPRPDQIPAPAPAVNPPEGRDVGREESGSAEDRRPGGDDRKRRPEETDNRRDDGGGGAVKIRRDGEEGSDFRLPEDDRAPEPAPGPRRGAWPDVRSDVYRQPSRLKKKPGEERRRSDVERLREEARRRAGADAKSGAGDAENAGGDGEKRSYSESSPEKRDSED